LKQPVTGLIELGTVLNSVNRHFPLLLAIEEERTMASGQRLAAEGNFDTNVKARALGQDGIYNNSRFDLSLEQLTPYYGMTYFGGYRLSTGVFPPYYGFYKTGDGGEFRGGVAVPLLRNGPIDRQRASVRQAQIAESLADPVIQRARIDYLRTATRLYWNWVAAGEQYQVAQELKKLAQDRQAGFETQFQRGAIAEIIVIDNRRLIAERQGTVTQAERRLQQTAIELSLYLRDDGGQPWLPTIEQLPKTLLNAKLQSPKSENWEADLQTAYANRPELKRFALLKERVAVDLQLTSNQLVPNLTTGVAGYADVGPMKRNSDGTPGDSRAIEGSVNFDMPLQFRDATGKQQQARGLLVQLQFQEQFAREQISADVQDAISYLDRALERIQRAREEVQIAQQVTDLEMTRFRIGQVTLLEVNIRELAAAGAKAKLIDALADFYRALADYRAALALDIAEKK
jgi:outer membrane protein, heavy metal efflux system